jgi:hypothetical protein
MQSKLFRSLMPALAILFIAMLACNLPGAVATAPPTQELAQVPVSVQNTPEPTATPGALHKMSPAEPGNGKVVYDVQSAGTAPEKRAPYGDSYEWNRLERPFTQDMSYVSDLDIAFFSVAKDSDWWYVSIKLIGVDPNNVQGINYGIELDLDKDGFGDYLIWAHPPYGEQWDTTPVQIFQDKNHNTGGLSGGKSDAPYSADGYEMLIFDGIAPDSPDPDMAWVRNHVGTVQFAFKRSWAGSVFMMGVIADAGWKDPKKLDYVDRLPISEAGSPVKNNMYYPLKQLFLVDNTCREAFGFEPTRYEPQICPVEPTPTKEPNEPAPPGPTPVSGCQPPPGGCGAYHVWNSSTCRCDEVVY